jgi:hypothetical protein
MTQSAKSSATVTVIASAATERRSTAARRVRQRQRRITPSKAAGPLCSRRTRRATSENHNHRRTTTLLLGLAWALARTVMQLFLLLPLTNTRRLGHMAWTMSTSPDLPQKSTSELRATCNHGLGDGSRAWRVSKPALFSVLRVMIRSTACWRFEACIIDLVHFFFSFVCTTSIIYCPTHLSISNVGLMKRDVFF